ncbi:hypothetical protein PENSPDRAFT_690605 [Peniophora sp. CONT]|nr:hypothetical protein PENSPDRAFT_690605 [Peniophora sp. CONT]
MVYPQKDAHNLLPLSEPSTSPPPDYISSRSDKPEHPGDSPEGGSITVLPMQTTSGFVRPPPVWSSDG